MDEGPDTDEPGPIPPEGRRKPRDPGRRRIAIAAVLMVWSLTATGALVWLDYESATESKRQTWTEEAFLLDGIRTDFIQANLSTYRFLKSGDIGYAEDAAVALAGAWSLAQDAVRSPAYGALDGLNLTVGNTGCAFQYYVEMKQLPQSNESVLNDTSYRAYFVNDAAVFGAMAALLSSIRPDGTDPLERLGPTVVTQVRADAGMVSARPSSLFGGC